MSEKYPSNTLHQVSHHVWWFTPEARTDRPSLGLVVGSTGTLMLDIGASVQHTQDFLRAVSSAGLPAPDFATLTHWHWDHTFGIDTLNIPILAHQITASNIKRISSYDYSDEGLDDLVRQGIEVEMIRKHMRIELTNSQRRTLKLRQPNIIIDKTYQYDLGDVTCDVVHVGGDHAEDSCVMYIPEDEVLFLGDCLYDDVYSEPSIYTEKVLQLITSLEAFGADKFIMGHANEIYDAKSISSWFAIIRQAFELIQTHGTDKHEYILEVLVQSHEEEDVIDFLDSIIAGFQL